MGDRPDRVLQHRGDYIVLHQIDGRLDPGSCFRCHGNKNVITSYSIHYTKLYDVPQGSLSPHQAALAWVLENPGVATTIPSMVSFSQVNENMRASGKRLGWGGRKALTQYARTISDRHCGLCGECAGSCPNGVDVPSILRSLTYLEGYRQKDLALGSYRALGPDRGALLCLSCRSCAVSCRLGLDVKRLALRAHRHLA